MRHANTNDLPAADDNVTYEQIFENHAKALWAEAYRLLKDSQEAKDIVQDLIIEIWEKRSLSNVQTNVRSYLFQSLRYKCYRHMKTKDSEAFKKNAWSFCQDSATNAATNMEREELNRTISAAIKALPLQSSNIFKQVFIEGKKRKEVALDLGLSINTVNVHIHTACKKLQEKLKKIL
jgi:RNA polymerase sigma-70 factor (ECF subfamily)